MGPDGGVMFDIACKDGGTVHIPDGESLFWYASGFTVLCAALDEGQTATFEVTRVPQEKQGDQS